MNIRRRDEPRPEAPDPHIKTIQADGRLCVYDARNREEAWIEGEYVDLRG